MRWRRSAPGTPASTPPTSVRDGRISQDEADGLVARVRHGEHSPEALRKQIKSPQ